MLVFEILKTWINYWILNMVLRDASASKNHSAGSWKQSIDHGRCLKYTISSKIIQNKRINFSPLVEIKAKQRRYNQLDNLLSWFSQQPQEMLQYTLNEKYSISKYIKYIWSLLFHYIWRDHAINFDVGKGV